MHDWVGNNYDKKEKIMLTPKEKQVLIDNLIKYEGNIPHMYLDSKGYVTVGIGHLLSTVQNAQKLPFVDKDGKKATSEQIAADYNMIAKQPKGHYAPNYRRFTKLHLKNDDILSGVNNHIKKFESNLTVNYPGFNAFPIEAKLALFDMGFNLGVKGLKTKFPNMNRAISKKDWLTAAKESHRKPPVAEARNDYVKWLFEKAAKSTRKAGASTVDCLRANGWRKA